VNKSTGIFNHAETMSFWIGYLGGYSVLDAFCTTSLRARFQAICDTFQGTVKSATGWSKAKISPLAE
jgi:hypothetical protein